MAKIEKAIEEASKNNRVCPMPMRWNQLYELLPNRRRKGAGWEPALPLILAAWHDTPSLFKALRLKEHLEWDASHGAIDQVFGFLVSLSESDWYHYDD
ncbi:hypothetical protein [uncultured Desulfosarcina sp.]|uniref:hypothetical protein n=1 Tax=uncultured Desulfosarcina sp. TaxID=218289 RepID=UPI0029C8F377|nr:hypothetical protein [uncultured Desulfosarcina sp.]